MDISIEQIGNSKGIRFSKALLNKYNFKDKVEVILEKGYIVLNPNYAIEQSSVIFYE